MTDSAVPLEWKIETRPTNALLRIEMSSIIANSTVCELALALDHMYKEVVSRDGCKMFLIHEIK